MRTAIISDIHGNLEALLAVLADAAVCECRRTICLGDLCDGGPADVEVVRELIERSVRTVRGNCDEHSRFEPHTTEERFIRGLPASIAETDILYTHITPRPVLRRIRDRFDAWQAFQDSTQRIAFIGHTHIPLVFSFRGGSDGAAVPEHFDHNRPVRLDPSDRYIVCVGSVGQGRDGIAAPRYALFDDARHTVEVRRVEPA